VKGVAGGRHGLAGVLQRRLSEVHSLEARLAEIVGAVPGRIAFSTSLGLEDQAVLHGLAQTGAEVDVFTLDTGRHFPATLEPLASSG
jgi:phosphoadenosine phosphosulfate reductase